jgi:hypothetical protein
MVSEIFKFNYPKAVLIKAKWMSACQLIWVGELEQRLGHLMAADAWGGRSPAIPRLPFGE